MSDNNVVTLIPNNALAIDAKELAQRVRQLADRIEDGQFGDLERVIVLLDAGSHVCNRVYGRQCSHAELVGLLEYAKFSIMEGE